MQVVVQPLPRLHLRHTQTRSTVGERREEEEAPDQSRDDDTGSSPCSQERLAGHALPDGLVARLLGDYLAILGGVGNIGGLEVEDELDQCTGYKSASKKGRMDMLFESGLDNQVGATGQRDIMNS